MGTGKVVFRCADVGRKSNLPLSSYDGGDLSDYILVDNTGGAAPKVVTLVAHNGDALTPHQASGHILVEDVTDVMA